MEILGHKKFSSPEEELVFLRSEIARKERELLARSREVDHVDHETLGKEVIRSYAEHDPEMILHAEHALPKHALAESHQHLEVTTHKVEELMRIALEKGVRNALSVLEKLHDPFLTDEMHRALVSHLRIERKIADLDERGPLWKVLTMTLFEVSLPRNPVDTHEANLKSLFSGMEQFYAGMQTISLSTKSQYYALEVAVSDKRDDIIFYVAVPNEFVNLFEKQSLSLFPHALLIEQKNDYNIFVEGGDSVVSVLTQKEHPIYPIKTHDTFEKDPLAVLLNAFSKIERNGGGASIQIVIGGNGAELQKTYSGILKRVEKGEKVDIAIRKSTFGGEMFEEFKQLLITEKKKDSEEKKVVPQEKIELFKRKLATPIVETNIRLVASAQTQERAGQILTELESSFHQFQNTQGNHIRFKRLSKGDRDRELKAFSFREFMSSRSVPLSLTELSTIIHFPI